MVNTFLDAFYTQRDGHIEVTASQASRFAKEVAGDFNPIHDPDSRRFCVPGDLLFSLVLEKVGLYPRMSFKFSSMVGGNAQLLIQQDEPGKARVMEVGGKCVLEASFAGPATQDKVLVEAFARQYVAFSGLNFPHYMKPLFERHGVMFHPQRPLVIYDSMDFELDTLDVDLPVLEHAGSEMKVDGRRAEMILRFQLTNEQRQVGTGSKHLLISGMRPYDAQVMDEVITIFNQLKEDYEAQ